MDRLVAVSAATAPVTAATATATAAIATPAAATTATTAAAVAATTTTAAALLTRTGLVDGEGPAAEHGAVDGVDGLLGFVVVAHFHEAEAARTAGVAVHD